jgi:hypothetical protein
MNETEAPRKWSEEELQAEAEFQVSQRLQKGNNQEYGRQGASRSHAKQVSHAKRGLKLENLIYYELDIPYVPNHEQWKTKKADLFDDCEIRNTQERNMNVIIRPQDFNKIKSKLVLGHAETETIHGWLHFTEALEIAQQHNEFFKAEPFNGGAPYWSIPLSYFEGKLKPISDLKASCIDA